MWERGEHVAVIGQTGSGKTYLLSRLLELRGWVILLQTKSDDTFRKQFGDYKRVSRVKEIRANYNRWLLVPKSRADKAIQGHLLVNKARTENNWCVVFDELFYATDQLKLESPINELLTQGRGEGITVVCGMQRPSRISRFALSEPTHAFIFNLEGRDLQSICEAYTPRLKEVVPNLKHHQFAYYNRKTRKIVVGYAQYIERVLMEGSRE